MPNFVLLDAIPQKQQIVRTTTDPQFIFAKPPPDYDEATKQLSKVSNPSRCLLTPYKFALLSFEGNKWNLSVCFSSF